MRLPGLKCFGSLESLPSKKMNTFWHGISHLPTTLESDIWKFPYRLRLCKSYSVCMRGEIMLLARLSLKWVDSIWLLLLDLQNWVSRKWMMVYAYSIGPDMNVLTWCTTLSHQKMNDPWLHISYIICHCPLGYWQLIIVIWYQTKSREMNAP